VLRIRNLSKAYERGGASTTALETITVDVPDRQFLSDPRAFRMREVDTVAMHCRPHAAVSR
jgi:hypothetical protein